MNTSSRTNLLSISSAVAPKAFVAAISLLFGSQAFAIQPLSEGDMSSVSAESQTLESLLGIAGDTAAGELMGEVSIPETSDLTSAVDHASSDSDRIAHEGTETEYTIRESQNVDNSLFEHIEAQSNSSEYAQATSIKDPKLNEITSNSSDKGLTINVDANIQRIQMLNMSHGGGSGIRGSQFMSNIRTQSSTQIYTQ